MKASDANNLVSVFILRPSKMHQIHGKTSCFTLHYSETSEAQAALTFWAVVPILPALITWLFSGLCYLYFLRKLYQFQTQLQKFIKKSVNAGLFAVCCHTPLLFCEAWSLKEQKNGARWKTKRDGRQIKQANIITQL